VPDSPTTNSSSRAPSTHRSLLFALWSKPEHFRRWMGPANFTCPEVEIDFRWLW